VVGEFHGDLLECHYGFLEYVEGVLNVSVNSKKAVGTGDLCALSQGCWAWAKSRPYSFLSKF
jgi:hypothetical protein